jgi:hypothetical protein
MALIPIRQWGCLQWLAAAMIAPVLLVYVWGGTKATLDGEWTKAIYALGCLVTFFALVKYGREILAKGKRAIGWMRSQ